MSTVLCIDDEPAILRLLDVVLTTDGHDVVGAPDARTSLEVMARGGIEAVILDLGLPDRDGLELLGLIKAISDVPVIVVSARHDVAEKVAALDLGAADYITKPFDPDELRARTRAALRRAANPPLEDNLLVHERVRLDVARHLAWSCDRPVSLTPKEFAVLRALVEAAGRILTHGELLEKVWGKAHRDDVEYLRVAIRSLRLKMEVDPSQPRLIRNEPGIGYRLA